MKASGVFSLLMIGPLLKSGCFTLVTYARWEGSFSMALSWAQVKRYVVIGRPGRRAPSHYKAVTLEYKDDGS